jgi:hypothetical protein
MKTWKVQHANKSTEGVKIAISTSSSGSVGVILQPGQFALSQGQNTASLDSQKRRGYVNVDEDFDNSVLNLKLGEVHNVSFLEAKAAEKTIEENAKLETIVEEVIEPVVTEEYKFIDKLKEAQKNASDFIDNK